MSFNFHCSFNFVRVPPYFDTFLKLRAAGRIVLKLTGVSQAISIRALATGPAQSYCVRVYFLREYGAVPVFRSVNNLQATDEQIEDTDSGYN